MEVRKNYTTLLRGSTTQREMQQLQFRHLRNKCVAAFAVREDPFRMQQLKDYITKVSHRKKECHKVKYIQRGGKIR